MLARLACESLDHISPPKMRTNVYKPWACIRSFMVTHFFSETHFLSTIFNIQNKVAENLQLLT